MRFLGYIVVCIICTNFGFVQAQNVKSPRIEFDVVEYDFGEVMQGVKATYYFRFRNIGDDTLVIEKIHAP